MVIPRSRYDRPGYQIRHMDGFVVQTITEQVDTLAIAWRFGF
jgi:hypothetical protein